MKVKIVYNDGHPKLAFGYLQSEDTHFFVLERDTDGSIIRISKSVVVSISEVKNENNNRRR